MSEIDFETGEPIWLAEVYHNTPDTVGIWHRAFNAPTEDEALLIAIGLFEKEGLPPARITKLSITELNGPGGGENG